ncbi:hypothetical protein JOM56_002907 [Amanita muscaria]
MWVLTPRLEDMRNVKIQHDMGGIKKEESNSDSYARLPEEEERRLLSRVTQVQSRFFEGKVVHCQNADITNEWSDFVKRAVIGLVVFTRTTPEPVRFATFVEHDQPLSHVARQGSKKTAETGKREVNQKNGTTSVDAVSVSTLRTGACFDLISRARNHPAEKARLSCAKFYTQDIPSAGISLPNLFGPAYGLAGKAEARVGTVTSSEAP